MVRRLRVNVIMFLISVFAIILVEIILSYATNTDDKKSKSWNESKRF